jgi:hypothetical protein
VLLTSVHVAYVAPCSPLRVAQTKRAMVRLVDCHRCRGLDLCPICALAW